jgi:CRP-like cAMP-binding protein
MQLEIFQKGEVIFEEFEESNNKMYIVISGRVAVVINKPFNTFGSTPAKCEYTEIDYRKYGTKVNEISSGEGFGEKVASRNDTPFF